MIPMSRLAVLLALGYRAPNQLDVIAPLDFNGLQAPIVNVAGRHVALVLGVDEPTDWEDFALRISVRTQRGDTTRWGRGALEYGQGVYNFWKGYLAAGGRIDEAAAHSLGSAAGIAAAALKVPCTCFAPMPILCGPPPTGTEFVRNVALADEPLLTMARLGPWLSFLVPPEIMPVRMRVFEPLWPPTWAPAHAIGRYAQLVPSRSAFGEVPAEPAIA